MSVCKTLLAVAIAAAAAPAAFADTGAVFVGGELGWVSHPFKGSSKTRAEVQAELLEFLRDGGRLPSGELGTFAQPAHQHTYVYENGRRVHADHLATMGAASAPGAAVRSERTRAQVRAELMDFLRSGGRLPRGELDPALYGAP